jgi:acyl-lipid omega-6 desaturase (Delta-12 desaturase)
MDQNELNLLTRPNAWIAHRETVLTLVPYLLLLSATVLVSGTVLTFLTALLSSFFLIRVFTLLHDCGHRSFHPSKVWENLLGNILGVLCFTPYGAWTYNHSVHHRHLNNLDMKIPGEVITLTVSEYLKLTGLRKFLYQVYRNPFFLVGIGGLIHFLVIMRIPFFFERKTRGSIWRTNLFLLLFIFLGCSLGGTRSFLIAQGLILWITTMMGTLLFYIQHQFEEALYLRKDLWSYQRANLEGSSFFLFPQPLRWFFNNIGHHHVHHLKSTIPGYYLNRALPFYPEKKVLTFKDILPCLRLNLYCEERKSLISFRDLTRSEELRRS